MLKRAGEPNGSSQEQGRLETCPYAGLTSLSFRFFHGRRIHAGTASICLLRRPQVRSWWAPAEGRESRWNRTCRTTRCALYVSDPGKSAGLRAC